VPPQYTPLGHMTNGTLVSHGELGSGKFPSQLDNTQGGALETPRATQMVRRSSCAPAPAPPTPARRAEAVGAPVRGLGPVNAAPSRAAHRPFQAPEAFPQLCFGLDAACTRAPRVLVRTLDRGSLAS
jgi:hypothetical protein